VYLSGTNQLTIQHDELLDLAFMAASSLFLSYRLRCQLYALVALFAYDKQQREKYDQDAAQPYILMIDFQNSISAWSATLSNRIDALKGARKDCVTAVHYHDARKTVCHSQGGPAGNINCHATGDDGFMFEGTFLVDNKTISAR
jgi:hypothetical protein